MIWQVFLEHFGGDAKASLKTATEVAWVKEPKGKTDFRNPGSLGQKLLGLVQPLHFLKLTGRHIQLPAKGLEQITAAHAGDTGKLVNIQRLVQIRFNMMNGCR